MLKAVTKMKLHDKIIIKIVTAPLTFILLCYTLSQLVKASNSENIINTTSYSNRR